MKLTKRMKTNAGLEALFACRLHRRAQRKKGGVDDAYQDALDKIVFRLLLRAKTSRYLFRNKKYRERAFDVYALDAPTCLIPSQVDSRIPHLLDSEFRRKYRMKFLSMRKCQA